jgi:hypothetical protein
MLLLLIKHRPRLAPCRLLLVVDLAERENSSLHRFFGSDTMVFYDTEVAMLFAVFFAVVAAQIHADGRLPEVWGQRKTLGLHSPVFSDGEDENRHLNRENQNKNANIARNWSSWANAPYILA